MVQNGICRFDVKAIRLPPARTDSFSCFFVLSTRTRLPVALDRLENCTHDPL